MFFLETNPPRFDGAWRSQRGARWLGAGVLQLVYLSSGTAN